MSARGLDSGLLDALDAAHVTAFSILTLEFDSGTQYLTDCPFDVLIDGITYTSAQQVGAVQPFTEADSGAQGIEFVLSGVPQSAIAGALSEPIQGRTVTLGFVVVDSGVLRVDPVAWRGSLDVETVEDGAPTATIRVTAESDLIRWQTPPGWLSNQEDHQQIYPGTDDLFHQKAASLVDATVYWPMAEFFKR